jgi:hypothetical protein
MKLLLVLLALVGCRVSPPTPPAPVDAATPPGACAAYCARMTELACEIAEPTPAGAACLDVCEAVRLSGIIVWDLACRAAAPTCEAADSCEAGRATRTSRTPSRR